MAMGGFGADDSYVISVDINTAAANAQFAQFNQRVSQGSQQAAQAVNNLNTNVNVLGQTFANLAQAGTTAVTNVTSGLQMANAATATVAQSTRGWMDSLEMAAIKFAAITAAIAGLRTANDAMREAARLGAEMGKGTSEWEQMLRPVQTAISGLPGPVSDQTRQSQLRMIRSGMSPKEAADFTEQFLGYAAIAGVGEKGVPQETIFRTGEAVQRYAMAMGGDVKATSQFGGYLAQRTGQQMSPEAVTTQLADLYKIASYAPGATTETASQLMRFLTESVIPGQEGSLPLGAFGSNREAASFFTAVTQGVGPRYGQTASSAASQALMGMGKGNAKFAEYMKGLGVTDDMGVMDRLKTLSADLVAKTGLPGDEFEQAMQDVTRGDETTTGGKRLAAVLGTDMGLGNIQGRRGIISAIVNRGIIPRILGTKEPTQEDVERQVTQYEKSRSAQAMQAQGSVKAAELEVGQQYQPWQTMLNVAKAQLTAGGQIGPQAITEQRMEDFGMFRQLTAAPTAEERTLVSRAFNLAAAQYPGFGIPGKKPGEAVKEEEVIEFYQSGEMARRMDLAAQRKEAMDRGEDMSQFQYRQPGTMPKLGMGPLFGGDQGMPDVPRSGLPGAGPLRQRAEEQGADSSFGGLIGRWGGSILGVGQRMLFPRGFGPPGAGGMGAPAKAPATGNDTEKPGAAAPGAQASAGGGGGGPDRLVALMERTARASEETARNMRSGLPIPSADRMS